MSRIALRLNEYVRNVDDGSAKREPSGWDEHNKWSSSEVTVAACSSDGRWLMSVYFYFIISLIYARYAYYPNNIYHSCGSFLFLVFFFFSEQMLIVSNALYSILFSVCVRRIIICSSRGKTEMMTMNPTPTRIIIFNTHEKKVM